jgi:hypothetical protein
VLLSLVAVVLTNVTIDDADLAYFTWSASTSLRVGISTLGYSSSDSEDLSRL